MNEWMDMNEWHEERNKETKNYTNYIAVRPP